MFQCVSWSSVEEFIKLLEASRAPTSIANALTAPSIVLYVSQQYNNIAIDIYICVSLFIVNILEFITFNKNVFADNEQSSLTRTLDNIGTLITLLCVFIVRIH